MRRLNALASTTLAAGSLLIWCAITTPASAGVNQCDAGPRPGVWRDIGGKSTFWSQGRRVALRNESWRDVYSMAVITNGWQPGDRVWIDRSIRRLPRPYVHPTDAQVRRAVGGGWKQCGPFHRFTNTVLSNGYAVRACVRPARGYIKCGWWNVDRG